MNVNNQAKADTAQQVRALTAKPEALSSSLRTNTMGGKTPACCPLSCTCSPRHMHTYLPQTKTNVNNQAKPNNTRLVMKNVNKGLFFQYPEGKRPPRDTHSEISGPVAFPTE